jgi:nicotinamide-nucleotide amidase
VIHRIAVGDSWTDIRNALDREAGEAEIILITGGLGPTADDITKPLLSEYFGGKLVVNQDALDNVKHIFEKVLKRPMIERNYRQAEVPDNCLVIQNKRGTAPGMWFERNGKNYVSMPGVPYEMKGMMSDFILPALKEKFLLPAIVHRTLLLAGIGESFIAEHIQTFESALPEHIRLAYLPNYGMVRLRLTATGSEMEKLNSEIELQFDRLKKLVSEWLVVDQDLPLEEVIGSLLRKNKQTLSTAESCTGGFIAHLITTIPGSSNYYKGSVVSYSNEVKEDQLLVSRKTLDQDGAVSEATVSQMVAGALSLFKTDYAIATSGIMGPDGGSEDKPVGTVWIAVGNNRETITQRMYFRFDRKRNIELTATHGLNLLRKFIQAQT